MGEGANYDTEGEGERERGGSGYVVMASQWGRGYCYGLSAAGSGISFPNALRM